jgi:predicted nucleotidyltransferase
MSVTLKEELAALCRRYRIKALYAFGSRSREIALRALSGRSLPDRSTSDVDIGVLPRQGAALDACDKARLMADCEDLLGVRRVDVVVLPEAPAFLAVDIIRGELLYDENPDRSAEYELYVLRRAGDLAGYERERIEQMFAPTSLRSSPDLVDQS